MSVEWDLRADGERYWSLVPEGPLLVQSHQTAYRVIRDFLLSLAALGAMLVFVHSDLATLAGALVLLAANSGSFAYYWRRERPLDPLAGLVSEDSISIGCRADAIVIPWVAIDTSATSLPVNNMFMVVPISRTALDSLLLIRGETEQIWDRKPYRRTILEVTYSKEMSWVEIRTNPNGFFQNMLQIVYPMLGIWRERHPPE